MRLGIQLDFTDVYQIVDLSTDLASFRFKTEAQDGSKITLGVILANNRNRFLPQVFNLGFGPFKPDGTIDDKAVITHKNSSKVYSTILLGALIFLNNNRDRMVGIDGSDMRRAYLYYRLLQNNFDYLIRYFRLIGIKYYARLLRGIEQTDPLVPDPADITTRPSGISKGESIRCDKLYNYFMFDLIGQPLIKII